MNFLILAAKKKNKNLKSVQKNGKQKKMKRKRPGGGEKGPNGPPSKRAPRDQVHKWVLRHIHALRFLTDALGTEAVQP